MLHRIYIQKKFEEKNNIERHGAPLAVIVCPTRELAEQVEEHVFRYAKYIEGIRLIGLQGAMKDINLQIEEIKKGVDVLVATPGRLLTLMKVDSKPEKSNKEYDDYWNIADELDFEDDDATGEMDEEEQIEYEKEIERYEQQMAIVSRKFGLTNGKYKETAPNFTSQAIKNSVIDLTQVKVLVLDEVDRILAMGLLPEMKYIYKGLPRPRNKKHPDRMQVMMFTATLVPRINELIKRFAPYHIKVDLNKAMNIPSNVKQVFYEVGNRRKHALLAYLLRRRGSMKDQQVLIFCRTKQRVSRLTEQLKEDGFNAAGIHGDQSLFTRKNIVESFRHGEVQILVSTDVMARGMDILNLPFVVNYDIPHNPEEYIHRSGRTGRAGASGTVISLIAKEPITIEIGSKITEIDEYEYLEAIKEFTSQSKLHATKVPGPWNDISKFPDKKKPKRKVIVEYAEPDLRHIPFPEEKDLNQRKKEYLQKLKTKLKNDSIYKKNFPVGEKPDFHPLSKKVVSLRDFKGGKYEEVVTSFDAKRARKLGIYVPENLNAIAREKKKAAKAKIHRKNYKRKM